MMGPKHISELLPGVLDGIFANDQQGTERKTSTAVGGRDTRESQCDGAQGSAGASPATPAANDRDSHQDRVEAQAQGLTIELPFPPSTNTYWRHITTQNRPRTLISQRGREYRIAVAEACLVNQVPTYMLGPLACTLDLYPPCARRRDCDNYAKALLDALTHALVYHDDSQIIDLHIRMHPKLAPGRVVVTLTPISAPQSAHNQLELAACT